MKINFPKIKSGIQKALMIINQFNAGTVTLIDEARLSASMASQTVNMIQTQDGLWSTRWGRQYYGTAISGETSIDGISEYLTSAGGKELIAVGGTTGKIYRSQNDGVTWAALTGATMTAGKRPTFQQVNYLMLISNGTDDLVEYNGTSLSTFSSLSAPTGLVLSLTGLTSGSYTAYYQVTALNTVGETQASTEASISINLTRNNWGTGDSVKLTWTAVSGATRYQIYYTDESGYEVYLDSVTSNSYTDNGTAAVNPYMVVPTSNTTQAPKFSFMTMSDNRLWGTADPNNAYRVYWGGEGQELTDFSGWYGGGWVDLEPGGNQKPIAIVHYHDTNGNGAATILTNDPEGIGSIWQVTLSIDPTSGILIPTVIKIVGSIGTSSPLGVLAVGNDIYFPNKDGIFTLGNAPQLLNVLATNEKSQLIRPSYRSMNQSLIQNICGIYYQGILIYSMALGTENDTTFILDIERKNWTWYWNFGVKQWFLTTDANGRTHLCYVPTTSNQIVEVSENFSSDFGALFNTSYVSGLMPFAKDDTTFARVKAVIATLGRLQGTVTISVSGMDARKGFTTYASKTITDTTGAILVVDDLMSSYLLSNPSSVPTTFAQASLKKAVMVNKKMNALQIQINSTGGQFTILSLVVKGQIIPSQIPSEWRQ